MGDLFCLKWHIGDTNNNIVSDETDPFSNHIIDVCLPGSPGSV